MRGILPLLLLPTCQFTSHISFHRIHPWHPLIFAPGSLSSRLFSLSQFPLCFNSPFVSYFFPSIHPIQRPSSTPFPSSCSPCPCTATQQQEQLELCIQHRDASLRSLRCLEHHFHNVYPNHPCSNLLSIRPPPNFITLLLSLSSSFGFAIFDAYFFAICR